MKRLMKKNKSHLRAVRHARVRARVKGTTATPRLSVFRGLRNMTVQLVDDTKSVTICYAHGREVVGKKIAGKTAKVAVGYLLGVAIAEKAKAKGITKVVFDRGGYSYHGRVAAVAEGARAGGLQF